MAENKSEHDEFAMSENEKDLLAVAEQVKQFISSQGIPSSSTTLYQSSQ